MSAIRCTLASIAIVALASFSTAQDDVQKTSAHVTGRFIDDSGRAIGGVEIESRVWPGTSFGTQSDAEGRFDARVEWNADHGETWYELRARRFGYVLHVQRAALRPEQALDVGSIELAPGGAIAGRVTDPNGRALTGARVAAVSTATAAAPAPGRLDRERERVAEQASASVAADGTFRIIGLAPGNYWMRATEESAWSSASGVVAVAPGGETRTATLALDPLPDDCRVEGRVIDPSGAPVRDARVTLHVSRWSEDPMGSMVEHEKPTAADGTFVFDVPPMDVLDIGLSARVATKEFDEAVIETVERGARDVVLQLGRMQEVHLHVVDAEGNAVEEYGWMVSVDHGGSYSSSGTRTGRHPNGRATLRVSHFPFELRIHSPTHNHVKVGRFEPGAFRDPIEVRLEPVAAVRGVVTFAGKPVAGAHVELAQRDIGLEGFDSGLYHALRSGGTTTDADGRFTIPNDFPHITYFAHAWSKDVGEAYVGPVKNGGAPVIVELEPGSSLRGTLRVPDGKSAAGVELEVRRRTQGLRDLDSELGHVVRVRPDARGEFALSHLSPGPWCVFAHVDGTLADELGWDDARMKEQATVPHVVTVTAATETRIEIDLAARPACRLRGKLAVGDRIREGYCYMLVDGPVSPRVAFGGVDREGRFDLLVHTPGRYRLVVHAGPEHHEYKLVTDLVDVSAGDNEWTKALPIEAWTGGRIRLEPR